MGKKNKDASETYTNPACGGWGYVKRNLRGHIYGDTGLDRVPYFYNLGMLRNGTPESVLQDVKVDTNKTPGEYKCAKPNYAGIDSTHCGDGILQMVKHPVHKR